MSSGCKQLGFFNGYCGNFCSNGEIITKLFSDKDSALMTEISALIEAVPPIVYYIGIVHKYNNPVLSAGRRRF
jgi:hypothetical protein